MFRGLMRFVRDTLGPGSRERTGLDHNLVATCRLEMAVFAPVDSLTDDDAEPERPTPSPKAKGKAAAKDATKAKTLPSPFQERCKGESCR